jgi:hypothetical protein
MKENVNKLNIISWYTKYYLLYKYINTKGNISVYIKVNKSLCQIIYNQI